jgi:DNA-binding MltR family transcriptional regulator
MANPQISRSKAFERLAAMSKGKRDFGKLSPGYVYPYGMLGLKARDPLRDRELVITAVAVLEQTLEEAILKKFKKRADADDVLFLENNALLTDLDGKARLAYLLCIIGPLTRKDVSTIRRIRNAFAHTRGQLNLDMPEFVDVIGLIDAPNRLPGMLQANVNQDARERFLQTCIHLAMYLAMNAHKPQTSGIIGQRQRAFRQ